MDKANIGKTLKRLREERELTMDMLVTDLNQRYNIEVQKGQLSRWENNVNDPSLFYAKQLADYYGVSVDYLLGLTDVRVPARVMAYARKLKKEGNK